jgi:cytochrome c biogenesis protein CcmG, thiol:disulfide interchange protein DsbE
MIGGSLLAVAAVVGGLLAFRPASGPTSAAAGGTAPAVAGPTATGGRFDLTAERGHWVLVNFFASWCTDCRAELKQLTTLSGAHPSGLQVVSVDGLDDSISAAERLIRAGGGHWPLVADAGALNTYAVESLPQSFLVSPTGKITDHVFGGITAAAVEAQVARAAH